MIDKQIKLKCTDNGKFIDVHVLNYKPQSWLDVAFNTVKLRLSYKANTRVFVGSMLGREFTIKEDDLPSENTAYKR